MEYCFSKFYIILFGLFKKFINAGSQKLPFLMSRTKSSVNKNKSSLDQFIDQHSFLKKDGDYTTCLACKAK